MWASKDWRGWERDRHSNQSKGDKQRREDQPGSSENQESSKAGQVKLRDDWGQAMRGLGWDAGGSSLGSMLWSAGSLRSLLSQRLARSDLCLRKMTLAAS